MKYDLHVHSTYSDGIKSLYELGGEAKDAGLAGFALTDHDTIAGWREIAAVEEAFGITVFPGVELSTEWQKRNVHILGYGIEDETTFREKLVFLSQSRVTRMERIVNQLNALGFAVTMDEIWAKAGKGTVGRPHAAAVLAEKGYVKDRQDAFDRYLNRGKPAYVERVKYAPWEACDLICSCGGQAVLAHPGLDNAVQVLPQLVEAGLSGLEVHHSAHTEISASRFAAMALQYGLFVTAGSDYHGYSDGSHGYIGSRGLQREELPPVFQRYLI